MAAKRKVNPELIDDENPEWTAADFARARPASEVLSKGLLDKLREGKHTIEHETDAQWAARKRKLNANGKPIGRPFKEQPKIPVTMRLDAEVVEFFRSGGERWQTRLNAFLAAHVKRESKVATAKKAKAKI